MKRDDDARDSRRKLLAGLAASAAGAMVGYSGAAVAKSAEPAAAPSGRRRKWGLVIDLDRCARCGGCVVACQQENNVAPAGPEAAARMRPIHWMDFLPPAPGNVFGHAHSLHALRGSALREGLPGGRDLPESDDGITAQIWDRCIGCRYCMIACPYARRYFNWSEPHWPGDDPSSLNPDVAPRPRGVVEKCTLCHHRIRAASERARVDEEPLTDEALRRLPACAQSCPTQAITFGDLADPDIRGCALGGEPARHATSSRGRHAAQGHLPAGGQVKRAAIVVLTALVTVGAYAWVQQSVHGDAVTDLRTIGAGGAVWGLYVVGDGFFASAALAGLALACVLRVRRSREMESAARMALPLGLAGLVASLGCVLADLGRPMAAMVNLPLFGRPRSPFFGTFTLVAGASLFATVVHLGWPAGRDGPSGRRRHGSGVPWPAVGRRQRRPGGGASGSTSGCRLPCCRCFWAGWSFWASCSACVPDVRGGKADSKWSHLWFPAAQPVAACWRWPRARQPGECPARLGRADLPHSSSRGGGRNSGAAHAVSVGAALRTRPARWALPQPLLGRTGSSLLGCDHQFGDLAEDSLRRFGPRPQRCSSALPCSLSASWCWWPGRRTVWGCLGQPAAYHPT